VTLDPSSSLPASSLIDTHCHLDDPSFGSDFDNVLNESRDAGVRAWIMVGFSPSRWDAAVQISRDIPGMAHMLGVHPGSAHEWNDQIRKDLADTLDATGARAVGEIGLDFYHDNAPYDTQRRALVEQLHVARELELPVVFHLRDAEDEMLAILENEQELPRMVFHSFDGSSRLTRFILEHDAVVGVGGLATRQKSEALREQLLSIPLQSMILETDSPYLIPARQKGRRNTPAHVRTVALFLADHLGCSVEEVARETTSTAESLFGSLLT
jgi:TatD DNase family protein